MSLLTTRNTYVYKNIRLYFYFWRWYLCGAEKQSQRVYTHEGVVGRRKSQWTTDFSQNSGPYIVYNSNVTCSNFSFSLTMVTPASHFFAFNWLCCLLPIGYLPKPGSVGVHICYHHRIQPCSQVKVIFRYFRLDAPVSISTVFTAPVGLVTFQQSPCWYYPWADAAVLTSTDTQHLWTWHFGDHAGLINLCQQHPLYSHPQVMLIYYNMGNANSLVQRFELGLVFISILFTNPSARAGYDTRLIFKQSLTGLNSEYSFS